MLKSILFVGLFLCSQTLASNDIYIINFDLLKSFKEVETISNSNCLVYSPKDENQVIDGEPLDIRSELIEVYIAAKEYRYRKIRAINKSFLETLRFNYDFTEELGNGFLTCRYNNKGNSFQDYICYDNNFHHQYFYFYRRVIINNPFKRRARIITIEYKNSFFGSNLSNEEKLEIHRKKVSIIKDKMNFLNLTIIKQFKKKDSKTNSK